MDWQQLCALLIVAAAFLWLLRTQVFRRGKGSGCGTCSGCPSSTTPSESLIPADDLTVLSSTKKPR